MWYRKSYRRCLEGLENCIKHQATGRLLVYVWRGWKTRSIIKCGPIIDMQMGVIMLYYYKIFYLLSGVITPILDSYRLAILNDKINFYFFLMKIVAAARDRSKYWAAFWNRLIHHPRRKRLAATCIRICWTLAKRWIMVYFVASFAKICWSSRPPRLHWRIWLTAVH